MKLVEYGGGGCWPISLVKGEKPEPSTFEVNGVGNFGTNACKVTFILKTPCGTVLAPNSTNLQLLDLQMWRLSREQVTELIKVLQKAVNQNPVVTETPAP